MNILFDAAAILGPYSKNRGIGNYAKDQFKTLISVDKQNNYYCINFFEDVSITEYIGEHDNLKEVYFFAGDQLELIEKVQYKEVLSSIIKKFIFENDIDIFYVTSPFDGKISNYHYADFSYTKVVVTIYDLIPYIFQKQYLPTANTKKWYRECINFIRKADRYLTISKSVKDDLIKYLAFDEKDIDVIYSDISKEFKVVDYSEKEISKTFNKFNIQHDFIMCTGGDDYRKNLLNLVKSYDLLSDDLKKMHQLVIVCKLSKHTETELKSYIKEADLKGRVILTNFVTFEELLLLYNQAKLMVFPSLYEGFGLPVVEAMACGTPVVTSNNSSLGEIAKDVAILVDPSDNNDIARGLKFGLTEADLDELKALGFERRNQFSWEEVARKTLEAFEKLKKNKREEKKKIAFFSPLPPVESGISDYSVDILNKLAEKFDIDVYVDDYEVDCQIDSRIRVFNHSKFDNHYHLYDEILYQMGNSANHFYMYQYIHKYSGIVVLHDTNMHGAFQYLSLCLKNDIDFYKSMINEDLTEKETIEYINRIKNNKEEVDVFGLEINGYVTNHAQKIIVHSDYSKEKLLIKDLSKTVKKIPLYALIEDEKDIRSCKRNLNLSPETLLISVFGGIHFTKRVIPILKAFKKIIDESSLKIKLIFVGKLDAHLEEEFNLFIKDKGLTDFVDVTGYVELDEFNNYMDATDIALNLRYPYNGETSATLSRLLGKGKAVIVNKIGSFDEIPDDVSYKLPNVANLSSKAEINNIYQALKDLINDDKLREKISNNARQYAKAHLDINIIADKYADCINSDFLIDYDESDIKRVYDEIYKKCNKKEQEQLVRTLAYLIS